MARKRVAINGFGRIGRAFFRQAFQHPDFEVVAVNDLGDIKNLAYLLTHDSVYGASDFDVTVSEDGKSFTALPLPGTEGASSSVTFLSEKDPALLPWKDLSIDYVVESTGFFVTYEKANAHISAGAKRVVVTAPMKDDPTGDIKGATILMGVNNKEKLAVCDITSNASCTTNAGSPLIAILDEGVGIEKAALSTVHGYTATQALVDGPSNKGFREGRAAAANIVPSSTGAAIAVTKAFTKLEGLFDGISMRVPVIAGSIVDITFIAKRDTSKEEINELLKKGAQDPRWQKVFTVTEEELVSTDILGARYGAIADLDLTRVIGGNLVKVCAWYDNEMGYTATLIEHVAEIARLPG